MRRNTVSRDQTFCKSRTCADKDKEEIIITGRAEKNDRKVEPW